MISHDVGDTVLQEILRRYNIATQSSSQLYTINKCVLLNGGIFNDVYQPILSQKLLLKGPEFLKNLYLNFFMNFFTFKFTFSHVFGPTGTTTEDYYDFYKLIVYNNGHNTLPHTIKYLNERYEYNEVWLNALNETVNIDRMFIYGPSDPINPPKTFIPKIKTDLPFVKLVKLNDIVGHYPQWEDPFTVFNLIQNFLDHNDKETHVY